MAIAFHLGLCCVLVFAGRWLRGEFVDPVAVELFWYLANLAIGAAMLGVLIGAFVLGEKIWRPIQRRWWPTKLDLAIRRMEEKEPAEKARGAQEGLQ